MDLMLLLLLLQVEPGAVQRLQGPGGFTLLHMACADKSLYMTAHTALSLMMGGFYHQQRLWGTQGPGSAAVVKLLLDAGADPNARTTSEASALHIAACSNSADVVRLLVAAGATACANKAYKGAAAPAAAMHGAACGWVGGSLKPFSV
jgi:ankyrin repeat protein